MDRGGEKDEWLMREPEQLEKQMSYMRQVNKSKKRKKKNMLWNRESQKYKFISENLLKH